VYGFCFVKGIPPTPEATEALIRRISFIRETHYGGFWDFTADLKHGDLAYSDKELRGHTDTTYFTDVSKVIIDERTSTLLIHRNEQE
jgi:trimethyllysine dioxygenase